MVMLSELLRHRLVDRNGHRARLLDLAVDLSAGDYPPVTRLLFAGHRGRQVWHTHPRRATDLWLHQDDDRLWLRGADISPWAVLRRLARGLLGAGRGRR